MSATSSRTRCDGRSAAMGTTLPNRMTMKRLSLPILACSLVGVLILVGRGQAEGPTTGGDVAPGSARVPVAPGPGLRAHIDPVTGASAGAPPEGEPFPSVAGRRRAVTQADAVSSPVAGGGVLIDVSGLFLSGMVAQGGERAAADCLDRVEE